MTNSLRPEEDVGRAAQATVFVSDPSAEAERIAQALRTAGYAVVDVPLSMLIARVAVQRPKVILVDADTEGAIETVARVRELPDVDAVDIVFLAKAGGAIKSNDDAAAHEGSGYFERPVNVGELLATVDLLTGGARPILARPTTPPPSLPSSRPPPNTSLPPPSIRGHEIARGSRTTPKPPPSVSFLPADVGPASMRRATSMQSPLSNELEVLLQEAEQRLGGQVTHESTLPSPEEEIEAVLPAEVLASLDDPLEDDDDDDSVDNPLGSHSRGATTGAGKVTTGVGTGASAVAAPVSPRVVAKPPPPPEPAAIAQASKTQSGTHHGATQAGSHPGASTTGALGLSEVQRRDEPAQRPSTDARRPPPPEPSRDAQRSNAASVAEARGPAGDVRLAAGAVRASQLASIPSVLGPGDAPRALAAAISGRVTGVLTYESSAGMRRAVLREGDLVTAASSIDEENLLAFLAARGELPRDRVEQLAGKLPPFGRHAGAALVAHGYLRQDQLWSVLRAHAEWLLGRALSLTAGSVIVEPDAPGRLKNEPSVFGGSTGAEVFIEVVRRVVAPQEALARLGGDASRVSDGPNGALLSESALTATELDWMQRAHGRSIAEMLAEQPESDIASVLYGLTLLGVFETIRAVGGTGVRAPNGTPAPVSPSAIDALDEEAIRARVRARLQLVEEGDYFAVLGVARDATGYEVKRAFLELRRAFEPSKILTLPLADLQGDVRKIATVLDEAYEILRDAARRERYRRAIDAVPRG